MTHAPELLSWVTFAPLAVALALLALDALAGALGRPVAPELWKGAGLAGSALTFVLSLGTSALYELGVVGDPSTGGRKPSPNLAVARQTIDALEMLRGKTRGNLDAEEAKLLEALLYELHMRFVEASRGTPSRGPGDPAA